MFPEDGIPRKTAAISRCVVARPMVHSRVLVPRQPDQGAGHSRHRPPPSRVLGFPSCGYGEESHRQLHSGQDAASDLEAGKHSDLPQLQIFIAAIIG